MQITLEELSDLISKPKDKQESCQADIPRGQTWIVIADRGFVWVGKTSVNGDFATIENSRCIRVWGTTSGIGELKDGPKDSTKLDHVGTVIVPMRAVIGFVKCTRDW